VTSLTFLETILSLTAQVTLLLVIVGLVTRGRQADGGADIYWAVGHVSILLLTAAAFLLPHVRLTTWADLHPAENYPSSGTLHLFGQILEWSWLAGAALLLVLVIVGILKASKIVRNSRTSERLRGRVSSWTSPRIASSKPIEFRVSNDCTGAFCWQIHRPIVVVPEVVLNFPLGEQWAIVRHELAHLRRQHPLHLFLQRLVEAFFWFHPLVWWASRQAAAAREIRCDREAVNSSSEAAVYLRSLLRLVELQLNRPTLLPAGLSFAGQESLLKRRANLLADSFERPIRSKPIWQPILAFLLTVVVCGAIWFPVNPRASRRSEWSPWPQWSARTLEAVGLPVRDYEVDGHRLDGHDHSG
jgi:bla regulator protein blaR1